MLGNIVLLCFPPAVAAVGALCTERKRKAVFCAAFAILLFLFAGAGSVFGTGPAGTEGAELRTLYLTAENISYDDIKDVHCPPAFMFLIKLCSLTGIDINVFVIITAGLCSLSAALFVYFRCGSPYEGAYIFAAGFMITAYISLSFFIALTICAHASALAQEHLFIRAAAVAAAAACFDASVLIAAVYYLALLIPNVYISSAFCAAAAAAFAFIPGMTDAVYSLFGEGTYKIHQTQILCASFAIAGAAAALLMMPMLKNRDEKLTGHIPVLCGGACLMLVSVWDGRLFMPAVALTMPAAVTLAPDIHITAVKFAQIVFPKDKKKSGMAVTAVCALLAYIPYVYMILTGCCGTEAFGISLFGKAV